MSKDMKNTEDKFYVDYIRLIYTSQSEKPFAEYVGNAITDALLDQIKQCIENNMISRLEFKCLKDDIVMTIYYENVMSHIGIVDMYNDLVYYFSDDTRDKTLIDIAGQVFESGMVCRNNDVLYKIILYWVRTGKRYPSVSWIKD